jgi:metallo-beta-lactamase family protein
MYHLQHHGAVSGVTGSCHRLTVDSGESLLVDCGLFQGAEATASGEPDSEQDRTRIGFEVGSVRALLVTHCHIDHVGRIPYLLAAGFDGPIYATSATCELLPMVIEDALKVGVTRNRSIIDEVVRAMASQLVPMDYDHWFDVAGFEQSSAPVKACFRVAGHILGSAYIELDIGTERLTRDRKRVIFSGDLGAPYSPLLAAPRAPYRADTLVIESTYGDRLHESRRLRRQRLQRALEHCLQDGGSILIPAFSIGRTQELLYELEDIFYRVNWSAAEPSLMHEYLDVIIDSPLAAEFTRQYRRLSRLWDAEARGRLARGRHPLSFEQLLTINSHEEHLQTVDYLRRTGRPAIVIAASGMCTGGRIVNYLKALLPDKRTDVLFVGYQAKGTPGRDIQYWGPKGGYVVLDGERVTIRANVQTLSGYSAHADQQDLINFVRRMRYPPLDIRIVHGDSAAKQALKSRLQAMLPDARVVIAAGEE